MLSTLQKTSTYHFITTIAAPVLLVATVFIGLPGCNSADTFYPDFSISSSSIMVGESITIIDKSVLIDGYEWTFTGGDPSSSTESTPPAITYNTQGTYDITLEGYYNGDLKGQKTLTVEVISANPLAPTADFSASDTTIAIDDSIDFTDLSTNTPTSWLWTFDQATPSTSTDQNPTGITYPSEGTFNVTLVATNADGFGTEVKSGYITVEPYCTNLAFDVEGNGYQVVAAGGNCWMVGNLQTTKYKNGDDIVTGLDSAGWVDATTGAYAHVGGNASNLGSYGLLYNGHAIFDSRGLCPEGWHPGTQAEWNALIASVGGESVAGGALRTTGGWLTPNVGATNSSGFSAVPAGFLTTWPFGYSFEMNQAYFWMATSTAPNTAPYVLMHNGSADLFIYDSNYTAQGMSCRCVKD